jgi:S-sulfosulfanyl-L-cysteine sulfohydrolase
VKKLIPEMKAQGAEVIVDLSHHGIGPHADPTLASGVEGINVILSGHDHQLTEQPVVFSQFPAKTYLIEGMSHGKYVIETDIQVDKKTHQVIAVTMKPYPTATSTIKPDPAVAEIIQNHHDGNTEHQGLERSFGIPPTLMYGVGVKPKDFLVMKLRHPKN